MIKTIKIKSIQTKLLIEMIVSFIIAMSIALTYYNKFCIRYITMRKDNNIPLHDQGIRILIFSAIVIGILGFIISFLLMANKHIRYIKHIDKKVKSITTNNLGEQIEVYGNDELAELCTNINIMSNELKNKFEHEREVERTKLELITNMSHDLRTPLTPIIAYLDILRKEKFKTKEEALEYTNSSYNLSIKLKKLIDELFEYTKLMSNEVTLELQEIDLTLILNQILGEYSPLFERKGLKVNVDVPEGRLLVNIDIEKMVRVFDNLLSNAEKYSIKPSEINLSVTENGDDITVAISNRTDLIVKDKLDKIFEKFYRVDTSRGSKIEGSGLGLAIAKQIVLLHKGEIFAECESDLVTIKVKINNSKKLYV